MKWMRLAIILGLAIIIGIVSWIKERGDENTFGDCARIFGVGWVTLQPRDTTQGALCTDQSGRAFRRTAPLY